MSSILVDASAIVYKDATLRSIYPYHRIDGPAFETLYGKKEWYFEGRRHREDGPAFERPGFQSWFIHGKRHREDGPAVIDYNVNCQEWWLNNEFIKSSIIR